MIEVKNLAKEYQNGISLCEITFKAEGNGVYGFVGNANSGVCELARVLCGLDGKDSGEIIYGENRLYEKEKTDKAIKKKIGYISEKSVFDKDMTVGEILDFVGKSRGVDPDLRARQIKEALTLGGLTEKADMLIEALSSSEEKRLSLAASLLGNPEVIIMVEPLRALDGASKEELQRIIKMLGRKKKVLLFTANASEAEVLCSYVSVMHKGKILLFDTLENIKEKLAEGEGLRTLVGALCTDGENGNGGK